MFFSKVTAFLLSLFVTLTSFPMKTLSQRAKDFRVTAYIVGTGLEDASRIDPSHMADITDLILISVAFFNTEGELTFNEHFDEIVSNVKAAIGDHEVSLYLNLIGPGSTLKDATWEDNMKDQSKQHNKAFQSGKLEGNIKAALEKYDFDGVFFDYEYPLTLKDWREFDQFIISLDETLGDGFKIGEAVACGLIKQSPKAMKHLDMVELMAYDNIEKDGTHSSLKDMKRIANATILYGFKRGIIDIGIPFYARPTTGDAYWYSYSGWFDQLDEKGFCYDEETGLTFSFNTYETVYEKTKWAIERGLGGVMIWHYACDTPAENEKSLFNAVSAAKRELQG